MIGSRRFASSPSLCQPRYGTMIVRRLAHRHPLLACVAASLSGGLIVALPLYAVQRSALHFLALLGMALVLGCVVALAASSQARSNPEALSDHTQAGSRKPVWLRLGRALTLVALVIIGYMRIIGGHEWPTTVALVAALVGVLVVRCGYRG